MTLPSTPDKPEPSLWATLADRVLAGSPIQREEALAILQSPDDQLLRLAFSRFQNSLQMVWQAGTTLFLNEREKWPLPGRLWILLTVKKLGCRDPKIQPA